MAAMLRVFSITLCGFFLVACGGSGGGSGPNTGTVSILITDASIDDYDQALLDLSSVTLIGAGGQETELLNEDEFTGVDLLQLRNVSELLLRETVTARSISKVRLGVENITLTKLDEFGNVTESTSPPVPTRKIDLNPQGPLEVRAGEDLLIMIDFDLHNSIKINETGNEQVRFRPLVKIAAGASGLVRLFGRYTEDADSDTTSICDLERISDTDVMGEPLEMCVTLDESNTSYFGIDGLPLDPGGDRDGDPSSSGDLMDGNMISVYGRYLQNTDEDVLQAEIIARGSTEPGETYHTVNGLVTTPWDGSTKRFELALAEDQSQLVELSNGGKVFNLEGDVLPDPSRVINLGQRIEARGAEGMNAADESTWLQAFVAFVSDETGVDTIAGEIETIDDVLDDNQDLLGQRITLITNPSNATNCVTVNESAEFYQIEIVDDVSNLTEITVEDLMAGDLIDTSGDLIEECILAQTVIKES